MGMKISNYGSAVIRQGQASCYEGSGRAPPLGPPPSVDPTVPPTHKDGKGIFPKPDPEAAHHSQHAIKHESYYVPYCYPGTLQGTKTICSGEVRANLSPHLCPSLPYF